ncbi:dixin-A-like isoform X2 [Xyrauchen texanus]|uniref:dixin-A-like isoform X2 n=1 Tax=Xyrauchen texanus TaxID=154827 RepID=UPI0022418DEF|nr:dixin-A-like isoform X2 [Xyrauchen texanus]
MGANQIKCLSSPSPTHTPKDSISLSEVKEGLLDSLSGEKTNKSEDAVKSDLCDQAIISGHESLGGCRWEDKLYEHQEQLEREMQDARKMVSSLQIVIRSRLDQSMEESQDLKRELLRFKQEARNLQGVKDVLQQRMAVQESSVLQLKQELLCSNMTKDELVGQNVELQRKLEERNRLLSEYKKELCPKDRLLQQQQLKLDESLCKLTESSSQQCCVQACIQRELEHKETIVKELTNHETEEHPGSQNSSFSHPPVTTSKTHHGAEELQLVRDALRSLRNSFGGHNPQHHTLDTLEQGVASLMDRLYDLETTHHKKEHRTRGKSPGHKATHSDSWPSTSKMAHSHSSPALNSSACTKVLYFTDRSLTPFMINLPKKLGEITLQDFKAAIDREGNYRYHFKALDPEFGTVKEEVFQDDAVVPGWEGKIVAWIEEDHGQKGT